MKFHPVAELFPLLPDQELSELAADIKANGLRNPILLHYDGRILDGRNRYRACRQARVEPQFKTWNGKGSLVSLVWSLNGTRRHLNQSQKAAIAVELLPLLEEEARARQAATAKNAPRDAKGRVQPVTQKVESPAERNKQTAAAEAARVVGTNRQYVADAKKLKEQTPELFEKVKSGATSITEAKRQVKEQKREERREENRQKVESAPAADVAASGAKFATIVIDPPWDWGDEGDINQLGRAKPDYATISIEQLMDLPVARVADDDCHLYLWITNRSLPKGFALLDKWGFRYVTALTWVKPSFGMGNYFRGQTEHVLFAVRGSQQLRRRDVGTVFHADRGKGHSAKPVEFYELVESCSPGPYLEMFGRQNRKDWMVWGEGSSVAA